MKKGNSTSGSEPTAEQIHIDYDTLEVLLACLYDAYRPNSASRKNDLRDAYHLLTGEVRAHVDEPDSEVAKGLFKYVKEEILNHQNQLLPENGGPFISSPKDEKNVAEKTRHHLARKAAEGLNDPNGNIQEYIYKRVTGLYRNRSIRANPDGYLDALRDWVWYHDDGAEKVLLEDFRTIKQVLAKHGILMALDQPFWRQLNLDTDLSS